MLGDAFYLLGKGITYSLSYVFVKLPRRIFVCTRKGHDFRYYGGGWFFSSSEYDLRCLRCGRRNKLVPNDDPNAENIMIKLPPKDFD